MRLKLITAWLLNLTIACPLLIGCGGSIGAAGPGQPRASDGPAGASAGASGGMLLVPSQKEPDFGILCQGSQPRQFFELWNPSGEVIELDRIETSCECLKVTLSRRSIAPGEKVLGCAELNLGLAPHFVGRLGIEVNGYAENGTVAFAMTLSVDVRPTSEFEGLPVEVPEVANAVVEPVPMPAPTDESAP